jgi:hypothetical protein
MKVAIKYCGGCNPDYTRLALVKRIEERLNFKVEFVSAEEDDITFVVIKIEGDLEKTEGECHAL